MIELHTAREVVEVLGGNRAVAELTGKNLRAVNNWPRFGYFPKEAFYVMRSALKKKGYTAPPMLWRQIQCHRVA